MVPSQELTNIMFLLQILLVAICTLWGACHMHSTTARVDCGGWTSLQGYGHQQVMS